MLRSDIDVSRFKRAPEAVAALAAKGLREQMERIVRAEVQPPLQFTLTPELAAQFQALAAEINRPQLPPEPTPPAPTEPPKTTKEKTMTTPNASIAAALGLPVGAPETDVLAACARLRNLEVEVVAITGARDSSAALGAVRALKEASDSAATLATELDQVKRERDQQNFEALIARGETVPVKLTPATSKLYRDRFAAALAQGRGADVVAELKGFLDVAPTIIAPAARQPEAKTGSGGAPLAWNGKSYADLSPMERHKLWQDNPELWRAMKDAHDQAA